MDLNIVGAYAAQVYQEAILNAVRKAEKAGGIPAMK
jgi:L-aminopeptidase/D-esterase-like protein